jgi:type IV pilus assembly protein PilE
MRKKLCGFTLIELMIALAVAAILSVIAINVFSTQLRASRRTDAINTIFSIALAEERYRATNTTYGTLAQVWGGVTTSTGGYYTLAITNNAATTFTITATAIGDQLKDVDSSTACTPLVLTANSGTYTKTPAICWPS